MCSLLFYTNNENNFDWKAKKVESIAVSPFSYSYTFLTVLCSVPICQLAICWAGAWVPLWCSYLLSSDAALCFLLFLFQLYIASFFYPLQSLEAVILWGTVAHGDLCVSYWMLRLTVVAKAASECMLVVISPCWVAELCHMAHSHPLLKGIGERIQWERSQGLR